MAIYTCNKCMFTFERVGAVDSCPDCAHTLIRDATEEEILKYRRNRDEFSSDNERKKKP